jgi:hypothetical protein
LSRARLALVTTRRSATESNNGAAQAATGDLSEAGEVLRRVLALVESGELEATTPNARALRRRIEGAALATEAAIDMAERRDAEP